MICKHCGLDIEVSKPLQMANHSRWCEANPKRIEYKGNTKSIQAMNAAKKISGLTNQFTKAASEGRTIEITEETRYKLGNGFRGKTHSPEVKAKIAETHKKLTYRRLLRSVRPYTKEDGTIVMLDSSWEEMMAQRLDELSIEWTRPEPIPWIDKAGSARQYFPDFYLPAHNLYLDPKNIYAFRSQKEKLDYILEHYKNVIILTDIDSIKSWSPSC